MSVTQKLLEKIADAITEASEKSRAELRAGFAQTSRSVRVDGALNRTIYPNTLAWSGSGRLVGWSLEGGAGGCTVRIYDGRDTSTELVSTVIVPAGATSNHSLPGAGVSFEEAVFVSVTGTLAGGSIYLGAVD